MNVSKNIGIKEIAVLANVSIGTVDRVLHGRTGVSKSTKAKVLKIIEETGFKRNLMASRLKLASSKTLQIAVLLPEIKNEMYYWHHSNAGIKKAVQELNEQGIMANYFYFNRLDPKNFKKSYNMIFEHEIDALITVPFFEKETDELILKAEELKLPLVFLDSMLNNKNKTNNISQNSFKAGMVAGRLLHGLVGDCGQYFVFNILNKRGIQINNQQREMGFRAYFEQNLKEFNFEIHSINMPLENKEELEKDIQELLNSDKTKGVFVTNARSFLVSDMLKECCISNVNIIGFDLNLPNLERLKSNDIKFLINQNPEFQGYSAIKGLFKYLTEQDASELNLDIPVEIIIKENADFSEMN